MSNQVRFKKSTQIFEIRLIINSKPSNKQNIITSNY